MLLDSIRNSVSVCKACELSNNRIITVFDKGNINADVFILGMVPGNDENGVNNKKGHPFIGRAGKLLDNILHDAGFDCKDYSDVYITNLCKCGLNPGIPLNDVWVDSCLPYFILQICAGFPKIIITLGKDALFGLMNFDREGSLGTYKNKLFEYLDVKVIGTYHPSYLLRGGGVKHKNYTEVVNTFKYAKDISN